jgi:putative Mg2+ transporter-C (MgtC) family protein
MLSNYFDLNTWNGIYGHEIPKLFISVFVGCTLGLEREIRGKSAGFRTLALICFGATLFTIASYILGVETNRDRIAANIITGIGFIGAGVIFRNNVSVSGITTAASIWVAAALGMLIGIGEYRLVFISLILALMILSVLDFVQFWIDDKFQHRLYKVIVRTSLDTGMFTEKLTELKLGCGRLKVTRSDMQIIATFTVSGKESLLKEFNTWLIDNQSILSFEW